MTTILVVEDEPGIALGLEEDLTLEGYGVEIVHDGEMAVRRARQQQFDLILLDVMLPGKDGFQVCRELRKGGIDTPIIVLTARTQEAEKILGLQLGADDYVTKPFSPLELQARIKAVLRRGVKSQGPDIYRFGDTEVDFARGEVRRAGAVIDVTPSSSSCSRLSYGAAAGCSAASNCSTRCGTTPTASSVLSTRTSRTCGRRSSRHTASRVIS